MADSLETSQAELETDVRRNINWFAPSGERHFVDPATISVAASALMGLFFSGLYSGLKDALKDEGVTLGKALGHQIIERMRAIIAGTEHPQPGELEQAHQQAQSALQTADPALTSRTFDAIEAQMRDQFAQVMPDSRAAEFAARVRQNVLSTLSIQGQTS